MIEDGDYSQALQELKDIWLRDLAPLGVKWPNATHEPALVFLFIEMPEPLSQAEITALYERLIGTQYDRQIRQITDRGWDIRSGNTRFKRGVPDPNLDFNEMRLNSITEPNPIWEKRSKISRRYDMAKGDWGSILDVFAERGCAVCGRQFPSYDKGHLDPLDSYNPKNVVPMCSECNIWGGGREVTFKLNKGTLIARPVKFGLDLEEE